MHIHKLSLLALLVLLVAGPSQVLAMSFDGNGHDYMAPPTMPEATTSRVTSTASRNSDRHADVDSAPPTRSGGAPATLNAAPARPAPVDDEGDRAEQRLQRWQSRVPGALK